MLEENEAPPGKEKRKRRPHLRGPRISRSDLIASVPERHTAGLRAGLHSFPLPLAIPEITISLLWHPRLDADPAHRWLRGCVRGVCAQQRHNTKQTPR